LCCIWKYFFYKTAEFVFAFSDITYSKEDHISLKNYKGLLETNEDKTVKRPKRSFSAVRALASVWDNIGKPVDAQGRVVADETRIQMGDRYVAVAEIGQEIEKVRSAMSDDDRQHLTVSIRADRDTEMGIINDVKQELRKVGALNINYSADKRQTVKRNKNI
jgi:hypothetical protein